MRSALALPCLALLAVTLPGLARAQNPGADAALPGADPPAPSADVAAARQEVLEAIEVVKRMKGDPRVASLLDAAKGVLIVPRFDRGAVIVGAQGGDGVLLARRAGTWSDPAFYVLGGVSVGLQAGGEHGPIALILMSGKALERFQSNASNWSLSGAEGLTVASYSHVRRQSSVTQDVILWSGAKGLFGGASVGVLNVTLDARENHAYYSSPVAPLQILSGAVSNPDSEALRAALIADAALP